MWFSWWRRNRERDLDRELRAHLDLEAEELGDRYAAQRALGNTALIKEATRKMWGGTSIDILLQDLRYALRGMRRSPALTAVAVLSLALGIGANTAIFSLIYSVMLKSLPVSHPEELLQVTKAGRRDSFSNPVWEQIRDRQDVFSGVFAYTSRRFDLASGGEARYAQGNLASGQFFETLGVHTVLGRPFTADDDKRGCPGVAVLGYSFWQRAYGGSADILGTTVSIDRHPFPIVGVTQPGFFGVDVGVAADVVVPLCAEPILLGENSLIDERSARWLSVIGRPKAGTSERQATARLKMLAPDIFRATLPDRMRADRQAAYLADTLDTIPVASGRSDLRSRYRQSLLMLMVVVGLVLLIACANVANLLLARGASRQREFAVRIALGAGRSRLIRQLLSESLLLSVCGAALGVLFARWGTALLIGFISTSRSQVVLDAPVDARMLAFTAAVAMLTGLLFGIAPAWRGTRVQPQSAMKANSRGVIEGSTFGLGKLLVMLQVALSMVLVVGAGLMLSTFWKLAVLDAGFDREHVLLVAVDLQNANYPQERREWGYRQIVDRLRALPGVRSVSISAKTPLSSGVWDSELIVDGYTAKSQQDVIVNFNQVSPGYFETLGTPLVAGRDFNDHDTPRVPDVAIVNQAFVRKYFGSANPLGRTFRVNNNTPTPPTEIIGVVKDVKYSSLREEIPATAYRAETQNIRPRLNMTIELRSAGPPIKLIAAVKAAMEAVNRDITLQFTTLARQVNDSLMRERLLATLSGFFGGLALLLACIGLYGVMSYNVARRRTEIGIRMALGAEQKRMLGMVLREVALLIVTGIVVGLITALGTTRLVSSFLYGTKPNDPLTLFLSVTVLSSVALLAGYLPARRAARLDPMTALRDE